jgi:hypothetical protein
VEFYENSLAHTHTHTHRRNGDSSHYSQLIFEGAQNLFLKIGCGGLAWFRLANYENDGHVVVKSRVLQRAGMTAWVLFP